MERVEKKSADFVLVLLLFLLIGVGISFLYSASYSHAEKLGRDPHHFFYRQLLWITLGTFVGFVASCTPLELFRKSVPFVLLSSFVFLLLTLVPQISRPVHNARRWIFLFGQSFQPSELAKVALIVYLANIFSKKQDRINDPVNSILPPLIIVTLFVSLILLQNDFSTAIFLFSIAVLFFFIAKVRLLYFILLASIVIPLGAILLFTKEHRVERLISYINPETDLTGTGFQMLQSKQALLNGGFWGRGLGMGIKKLGALPEAHSDFIFAVVGEEIGFIGMVFILFLFLLFAYRGYYIAVKSENMFNYYLAFGITTIIFFQALLNMAVVAGLVPATGIPLPFFSNGGSSIFMTLFMSGLLVNISRQTDQSGRFIRV